MALRALNTKKTSVKQITARTIAKSGKTYNNVSYSALTIAGRRNLKVQKISAELTKSSTGRKPQRENIHDTNMLCEDLINSMGISLVVDETINKSNYSMIATQTDTELVMNPNKIEMSVFKEIKKGNVLFEKILKDPDDSFYRLDEAVSKNYKREQEGLKKQKEKVSNMGLTRIVSQIYDVNYGNSKSPNIRSLKGNK